jgi:hypothetical protein
MVGGRGERPHSGLAPPRFMPCPAYQKKSLIFTIEIEEFFLLLLYECIHIDASNLYYFM